MIYIKNNNNPALQFDILTGRVFDFSTIYKKGSIFHKFMYKLSVLFFLPFTQYKNTAHNFAQF